MSLYVGPDGTSRLGDILCAEFEASWTRARFAIAYAKLSGIDYVYDVLSTFAATLGHSLKAAVGIDQHGTSYEALAALLNLFTPRDHGLYVCYNPRSKGPIASPTFHPKLWLFDNGGDAKLLIGSGNLTGGGLYTNYEIGSVQVLDLQDPAGRGIFDSVVNYLDRWTDASRGDVKRLDQALLDRLHNANLVMSEDEIRRGTRTSARARILSGGRPDVASIGDPIFSGEDFEAPAGPENAAPRISPPTSVTGGAAAERPPPSAIPTHSRFYIHLSPTAKTEIYLAQAPLRDDPAFFGLPFTGRTEPRGAGNPPQPQANPWPLSDVTVYSATGVAGQASDLPTKMWQYMEGPNANKDVRIYFNAELQRLIEDGSVCVMERDPRRGIDYGVSIYAPGHPEFARNDVHCITSLPNSNRKYGWS